MIHSNWKFYYVLSAATVFLIGIGDTNANPATNITNLSTKDRILKESYDGSIKNDHAEVTYAKGLGTQATCLLDQISPILSFIQHSTGYHPRAGKIHIYLLKNEPDKPIYRPLFIKDSRSIKSDYQSVNCLLFAESEDGCEKIISRNEIYPYVLVHELIEMSLTQGGGGVPILIEGSWHSVWPFDRKGAKSNRWFREGFASYVGYLVRQEMWLHLQSENEGVLRCEIENPGHNQPFSSLKSVGKSLFNWPQYTKGKFNNDVKYYNASLGLFLWIRHRYGEQAIKDISTGLTSLNKGDGKSLIQMINQIIHDDIESLVEDFPYPVTGLETDTTIPAEELKKNWKEGAYVLKVEPFSLASAAGILPHDKIQKVNEKEIKTNLDLEWAFLDLADCSTIKIELYRNDKVVVNLPLKK